MNAFRAPSIRQGNRPISNNICKHLPQWKGMADRQGKRYFPRLYIGRTVHGNRPLRFQPRRDTRLRCNRSV